MRMTARIAFADNSPDADLPGVTEVHFKDGESKWTFYGPNGLTTYKYPIGKIAYIQFRKE